MSCTKPSPSSTLAVDNGNKPFEFEFNFDEDEKQFYLKAFPNVEQVRERRTHCTVCRVHLGTAPAQQPNIKMHPILRVTLCAKCFDFYNTGEFSKGEDGSELYCRWCGQGGEVYCCSKCPFVFCKSCIVKNLERGVVSDIEKNENWNCFRCSPKILWPLRAQHWALMSYMLQQKREILALNLSEEEKKQRMNVDNCTCCRLAKSRASNLSSSMESLGSTSSRTSDSKAGAKKIKAKITQKHNTEHPAKRVKENNDEVVCTPDLQSMLEPDCQLTTGTAVPVPRTTPPPLVLRNSSIQIRTVPGNFPTSSSPVYHIVNGFRIDLNSAAQKGIYTLPNGKMIQVKRTGVAGPNTTPSAPNNGVLWSRPCDMRPVQTFQQKQTQSNSPQLYNTQTFPNSNLNNSPLILNSNANQNNQAANALKRHVFPPTPVGQARSGLQDKIISAQIIYQHFNNKLLTFCNSNAYKQAKNYRDVKDLYVTLSYMCTYTMSRMQGLQNEILEDMRQLGFGSAATNLQNKQYGLGFQNKKEEPNADDIQIIEPKTDTITIDSDDENTTSSPPKKIKVGNTELPIKINKVEIKKVPTLTGINIGNRPMHIVPVVKSATMNTTMTSSTIAPAAPTSTATAPNVVTPIWPQVPTVETPAPMDVNNSPNLSEDDMLLATQSILASMLEVEIEEPAEPTELVVKPPPAKKQPRKKTTNKENPAKTSILQRERLEYLKKNDKKLKAKCEVRLTRVDEDVKYMECYAKLKLAQQEAEKGKIEDDDIIIVEDAAQNEPRVDENEIKIINEPIPENEDDFQETAPYIDLESVMPYSTISVPPDVDDMKENTDSNAANDNQKRLPVCEINEANKTDKSPCKEIIPQQQQQQQQELCDKSVSSEIANDIILDTISDKLNEPHEHEKELELQDSAYQTPNMEEEPLVVNEPLIDCNENGLELPLDLELDALLDLPTNVSDDQTVKSNEINEMVNEHTYSSAPLL